MILFSTEKLVHWFDASVDLNDHHSEISATRSAIGARQERLLDPIHRRMTSVLDLDPVRERPAR
jgi:hypothetical protein